MNKPEDKEKTEQEDKEVAARLLGEAGEVPEITPQLDCRALLMSRAIWLRTLALARANFRIARAIGDGQNEGNAFADGKTALNALDKIDKELVEAVANLDPVPQDIRENLPKEVQKALKEKDRGTSPQDRSV